MYIDVHCHLTGDEYDGGAPAVIARANADGVGVIVASGFDLESSAQSANIAEKHDGVYFCAGFHPSELNKVQSGDLGRIQDLLRHPKCVAAGEIGLDYHFPDNPDRETQRRLFVEQLLLADGAGLPVVIHSRDAAQETLELLKEHRALLKHGGLLHCYSYSPEMVDEFANLGLYFSFGGTVTFKNAKKVQESARRVPIDRILSETDCPYLTPTPFRGVFPNEPKNVRYAVETLAEIRNEDKEMLKTQILANAKRLFFKLD